MTKTTTIRVDAAQYEDHDDCLTAAAADAARKYDLDGWGLNPRWEDDQRESILLDIPAGTISASVRDIVAAALAEDEREGSRFDAEGFSNFCPDESPDDIEEAWSIYETARYGA